MNNTILSLGINKVLKGLTFIKSKATDNDYNEQVKTFFKDTKIIKSEKYGFLVSGLNTKTFYALKYASFGFNHLTRKTTVNDTILKDIQGYNDYKKDNK